MVFQNFFHKHRPKHIDKFVSKLISNKLGLFSHELRIYMFFSSQNEINNIFSEIDKTIRILENGRRSEISEKLDGILFLFKNGFVPTKSEENRDLLINFFSLALENCHKDLTNYFVEKQDLRHSFKKHLKKLRNFCETVRIKILEIYFKKDSFNIFTKRKFFQLHHFFPFPLENSVGNVRDQNENIKVEFSPLGAVILNQEPDLQKKLDFVKFILEKNASIYGGIRIYDLKKNSESFCDFSCIELAIITNNKEIFEELIAHFSKKLLTNKHMDKSIELGFSRIALACQTAFKTSLQQKDDFYAKILCEFASFIKKNLTPDGPVINVSPEDFEAPRNIFKNFFKVFTEEKSEKTFILKMIEKELNIISEKEPLRITSSSVILKFPTYTSLQELTDSHQNQL